MSDLDRSLAFTALCELHPTFKSWPAFGGAADQLTDELVVAWERDRPKDKWAYAKAWIAGLPDDLKAAR